MNAEPALLSALDALTAEIRALRVDLRRSHTSDMDGTPDATLLVEIDAAFGNQIEFTTAELVEHSALPSRPLLREAIVARIGADVSARKLGKRLAAIKGCSHGGLRLLRCGTKRHCAKWRVTAA